MTEAATSAALMNVFVRAGSTICGFGGIVVAAAALVALEGFRRRVETLLLGSPCRRRRWGGGESMLAL